MRYDQSVLGSLSDDQLSASVQAEDAVADSFGYPVQFEHQHTDSKHV